jgi:hypothetical protein
MQQLQQTPQQHSQQQPGVRLKQQAPQVLLLLASKALGVCSSGSFRCTYPCKGYNRLPWQQRQQKQCFTEAHSRVGCVDGLQRCAAGCHLLG